MSPDKFQDILGNNFAFRKN